MSVPAGSGGGGHEAVAAGNNAADGGSAFGMFRQGRVFDALPDLNLLGFDTGPGRDGFVNISRHGKSDE